MTNIFFDSIHLAFVLEQMRESNHSCPDPSCTSSCSSTISLDDKDVLLELNPALSDKRKKFKYVSKKDGQINYSDCSFHCPNSDSDSDSGSGSDPDSSGSGSSVYSSGSRYGSDCGIDCGSDCENCTQMKVYIPVSCSKKCKRCFGRSPGCGRNYGFKNIRRGLKLCKKTYDNIRTKSSEIIPLLDDNLRLIVKI